MKLLTHILIYIFFFKISVKFSEDAKSEILLIAVSDPQQFQKTKDKYIPSLNLFPLMNVQNIGDANNFDLLFQNKIIDDLHS
jgi:hypothetical protein